MRKMIFALVAMVMMSGSVMAQSNNGRELTFERISSFLDLTIEQMEPVRTAMSQFVESQKGVANLKPEQLAEGWSKVISRHRETMKQILNEKQYQKYDSLLSTTLVNAADRYQEQPKK